MKKISLIFVILMNVSNLFCQIEINFNNFDTLSVEKYKFTGIGINQNYLQMNYSGYKIFNPDIINDLKDKTIEKIELVYTDYPKSKDLTKLNKKRLASLFLLYPDVFDNKLIKWALVKQTACNSSDVYNYFHGFVITYRPTPTYESISSEKSQISSIVYGEEMPKDSTVLKILDRNSEWNNMLIVCDFTGSMSPYVSQVLLWHYLKIKEEKVKSFVFFNDGNRTADYEKVIGKTGGIYCTDDKNIDTVINTAIMTISSGTGGDAPENDIEAILYGIEKFPETENVILVADNKSDMRDTALICKITKPIKVILCGTENGINTQYLNLARNTGGSVHTIEEDLENLIDINEGEEIRIGDTVYKIKDGKFIFHKKVSDKLYSM